jgi:hypothetical protein
MQKENFALIMGKELRYLDGKVEMLKLVLEYMPVHATMRQIDNPTLVPNDVFFYGVVDREAYQSIINKAKVALALVILWSLQVFSKPSHVAASF